MSKEQGSYFDPRLTPEEERKIDLERLEDIEQDARQLLGDNYDGSGHDYINSQNRGLLEVEKINQQLEDR